jgi:hypothetical protein
LRLIPTFQASLIESGERLRKKSTGNHQAACPHIAELIFDRASQRMLRWKRNLCDSWRLCAGRKFGKQERDFAQRRKDAKPTPSQRDFFSGIHCEARPIFLSTGRDDSSQMSFLFPTLLR